MRTRTPRELTEAKIAAIEDQQLYWAKKAFFDSGGGTEHLITLIGRVDIPLTSGTRQFIARVLSGDIKPKKDRKPNYFRDYRIYQTILAFKYRRIQLTYEKRQKSKTNSEKIGAFKQVADIWRISETNAKEIYKRMRVLFKDKPEDYI